MKRSGFLAAIAIQLMILALVPYKKVMAWKYGEEIVLAARLHDPFDPFRGYYVAMEYEAGQPLTESRLQVGNAFTVAVETLLNRDSAGISRPEAFNQWRYDRPRGRPFISGIYSHGRILYGIEKYYIPETRRYDVELALASARASGETFPILAHVKVDSDGNSMLMGIEVSGKRFEF